MKYESLNNQGVTLLKKNQLIEAKNSFEKALQFKPNFTEAINSLGQVNHKLGNLDQAVRL